MKPNLNYIPSFIFTILIISFIFWNRILRIREPKDFANYLELNISISVLLFLFILFISFFLYYLLRYLKIFPKENSYLAQGLEKIEIKLMQYNWYNNFNLFINNHIINGPKNVFDHLYDRIYVRPIGNKLQGFAVNTLDEYREFIYLFIFVLIRFIIAVTFVVEIIFFKQIKYFYMLLIILLIPLITKFLLYFIEYKAKKDIEYYEKFFKFSYVSEEDKIVIEYTNLDNPEDIKKQEEADFNYCADVWFFYQQVYNFVRQIYILIDREKYLINSIYYGLFSIGFFFYIINIYPKEIHFSLFTLYVIFILCYLLIIHLWLIIVYKRYKKLANKNSNNNPDDHHN